MEEILALNFKAQGHLDLLKLTPEGTMTVYIDNIQKSCSIKVKELMVVQDDTYLPIQILIRDKNEQA
jgi:hypothetical protein